MLTGSIDLIQLHSFIIKLSTPGPSCENPGEAMPRSAIATHLRGLLAYKGLSVADGDLLDASLELYGKENLDYVDCLLAASASRGEGQVFTFDERLDMADW